MQFSVKQTADPQKAIAESANPMIRLLTVPRRAQPEPQADVTAAWQECKPESVADFSAVGYFFGRDLQQALKVPVGLINTSYGGTPAEAWTSSAGLKTRPEFKSILDNYASALHTYPQALEKHKQALEKHAQAVAEARKTGAALPRPPAAPMGPEHPHSPSGLYNAMIHPLLPFGIRGAIWYQGESNAGRAYQYRTLFPAMIADWRQSWGQGDFPFLFVQLAPFMKKVDEPGDSSWAELREAQLLTTQTSPNTAMAVITDVGEEDDIHPKKKAPVGGRLALAARALAYGESIEYSGPVYKEQQSDGERIILSFSHANGLTAKDGDLRGFAIAGADGKFVNADARIDGDRVIVSSAKVAKPVAVRYGWANYALGNLWNAAGLPASPFRTDDFRLTTQN
ncbi:MAG: sialate O-acetylesterase [Planctomycetes bacterium]|nr:sialate O-acetylesterase [Planctomycetota bacterium]